jgi:uncharacterized membrane protein YdbT with pleckstrin-like domain
MGNYVDSHLIKNETVVYEAKLHWIIYLTPKALLSLWIAPFIHQVTSEFAITTKRVIIKVGFISRRTLEMNLSKIETVNVDQSIMGRILNYGSITIIGTGGTREVFNDIASPMQFRKAFQEIDIAQE